MSEIKRLIPNTMIPKGFIVFISGVPGVGKTTISYELLKQCNEFRIIQETDLIREILRGYNDYLEAEIANKDIIKGIYEKISIPDHMKIFNFEELKEQCLIMKRSIEKIVARQQRKGISSVINGVHIVPEVLNGMGLNHNIVYVNLYINSKSDLRSRLSGRDEQKYMPYLDVSFDANCSLYDSTSLLSLEQPYTFTNIDVTCLTVDQVVEKVIKFLKRS